MSELESKRDDLKSQIEEAEVDVDKKIEELELEDSEITRQYPKLAEELKRVATNKEEQDVNDKIARLTRKGAGEKKQYQRLLYS